jgi:hypothetical protein
MLCESINMVHWNEKIRIMKRNSKVLQTETVRACACLCMMLSKSELLVISIAITGRSQEAGRVNGEMEVVPWGTQNKLNVQRKI